MKNTISLIISIFFAVSCIVLGFSQGIKLDAVQEKTLLILSIICAVSILYCFIAGELSRNNSQMDKLWSVLPIAYIWVICAMGGFKLRLVIIAVIVSLWGIRLTYNFAKKGAYSLKFWSGEEDYRWVYLRSQKPFTNKFVWCLFDLVFISTIQNVLVLAITLPALAVMSETTAFGIVDILCSLIMLLALIYEIIADRQQNRFQVKKYEYLNSGMKLQDLPEPYNRGFNITGLWGRSRHPNYIGEQMIWFGLYLFVNIGGVTHFGVFHWSIFGIAVLFMIFVGSSRMAESISLSKYPEYAEYQRQVFKYLPIRKYKTESKK